MTSSLVLSIVTFLYAASMTAYWGAWIFRRDAFGRAATALGAAGLLGNLAGFVMRWVESYQMGVGHVPLSNMYESLIFFSMMSMAVYLVMERQYGLKVLGAFVAPLCFLAMAYASLIKDSGIRPLVPALKSNWLTAHVFTCFLGYAAFALAFGLGIIYLVKTRKPDSPHPLMKALPEMGVIDELMYQNVLFGFLFLTLGIITGAVWANTAWGRYWSWDNKETWSLITWLIYAALIHSRHVRGWEGKRLAWFSIGGFAAVLFTWFGVNLFLSGLHSYT
ncbi:MAG: c-type cytochrome biogenesis protein CcsB [Deltaproteobacteria bacterium]|nr:c-type cytochrome biogenesis protein CcsB [Deltaproteobacteria bacterium]